MALVKIPEGYLFIALTLRDAPMAIMHWPTIRKDISGDNQVYPATPENIEKRIRDEGHDVVSYRFIEYWDLPQDRTYRDALKDHGTHIGHDMTTARAIHIEHARVNRIAALEQLDRDWMRATGQGKKTEAATLEANRQAWRDLPATLAGQVESAQTIEELQAIPRTI